MEFLDCEYHLMSEESAVFEFNNVQYKGKPAFQASSLSNQPQISDEYGKELFKSLFPTPSDLRDGYKIALSTARQSRKPLRFRLRIDANDDSVLHRQNWERMIDPDENLHLGRFSEFAFSRFLSLSRPSNFEEAAIPKVLVVISCPQNQASQGLSELSVQEGEILIHQTFLPLVNEGVLSYEILQAPATRSRVRDKLISGNFQILHIQAHGVLSRGAGDSSLVLELENREADYVNQSELAGIFGGIPGLNLVTLVTCHSGTQAGNSPFKSLAGQIVKDGIPAVVAMQQSISVEASRHFVGHFYRNLAQKGFVDVAINEARNQIALLSSIAKDEWSKPLLQMRLQDGKVLQSKSSNSTVIGEVPTLALLKLIEIFKEKQIDLKEIRKFYFQSITTVQSSIEINTIYQVISHLCQLPKSGATTPLYKFCRMLSREIDSKPLQEWVDCYDLQNINNLEIEISNSSNFDFLLIDIPPDKDKIEYWYKSANESNELHDYESCNPKDNQSLCEALFRVYDRANGISKYLTENFQTF